MKLKFVFVITILFVSGCSSTNKTQLGDKQYVLLISIDGFRYDYAEKYEAKNILALANKGVQADGLIPPFPSKTFPSHYTIATGMYPENHGIIDNQFYDPETDEYFRSSDRSTVENGKWYAGSPIWSLAEQQGINTASYYWIGSEAKIKGERPTYFYKFDKSTPIVAKTDQIISWLKLPEKERPRLVSAYFSLVDKSGHSFGPNSPETANAVQKIDNALGLLIENLNALDLSLNIFIVSDHGMLLLDQKDKVIFEDLIDWTDINFIPRDAFTMIYSNSSSKIDSLYAVFKTFKSEKFSVYKKEEIPKHLHFNRSERIGDLMLIANPPYFFGSSFYDDYWGTHGFDPYENKEMQGIFYASGPSLKSAYKIPAFESIHIYPLLAQLLELSYDSASIDGQKEVLDSILN